MARTLYDISNRYQNLWELCMDENIDLDMLEEALQSVEGELEDKVTNGIGLIQELKYHADAMSEEVKRLSSRKRALENKIECIKKYYLERLQKMGKSKVLTNRGTMSVVKSGGKCPMKIDDEALVPPEFKYIVTEVDKDALRQALESGKIIQGAHLEERTYFLKIL